MILLALNAQERAKMLSTPLTRLPMITQYPYKSAPLPEMYQYGRRNPANLHKRPEKHIHSLQN